MAAELNPPTAAQGEPARLEREVKAERRRRSTRATGPA